MNINLHFMIYTYNTQNSNHQLLKDISKYIWNDSLFLNKYTNFKFFLSLKKYLTIQPISDI